MSGTFSHPGGTIVLFVAGSAFTSAAGRPQIRVLVDGQDVAALRGYAHTPNTHITLIPAFVVLSRTTFPAGTPSNPISRTVQLVPINCGPSNSQCLGDLRTTNVDHNDFANVMVMRLPTP